MVIRVEKGLYHIWDCLQIRIVRDIEFIVDQSYVLVGDNGSGKTSFVKQVLLPKLQAIPNRNFHLFYIDQEFLIQYHAIQSHSVANRAFRGRIRSYEDAIYYMYDFYTKYLNNENFLFLIFDETEVYAKIELILRDRGNHHSIIVSITHDNDVLKSITNSNIIVFEKSSDSETVLKSLGGDS